MKSTDDTKAKLRMWALESKVHALPKVTGLPHFGSIKFDSCEAFNAWKHQLLRQIALNGGVHWTK